MSSLGKGFTWGGLAVRENYVWCHHYGGWRSKEVRGRSHHMGGQETKEKTFFMVVDPSKHHVIILGTDIPFLHSFL